MKKLIMVVILVLILAIAFSGAAFAVKPTDNHGADVSTKAKDPGNNKAAGNGHVGMPHLWNKGAVMLTTGDGPQGTEDRISVKVKPGTTLGDILEISWATYIVEGYLPHVDIILDKDGDGVKDDALVAEGAYANGNSVAGWPFDTWIQTFEGASGVYPLWGGPWPAPPAPTKMVEDGTAVWLNSQGQFPHLYTLAYWKAGTPGFGVDSTTSVLRLEIEVDNWVLKSTAWVDDINVTYGP